VGALGLLVGDRHLAEELAQEALTRACRDWERVRSLIAHCVVYRIAVNLAMQIRQRV
jgi:DNA-directed RNA polymerase specialized sigma24 family protein